MLPSPAACTPQLSAVVEPERSSSSQLAPFVVPVHQQSPLTQPSTSGAQLGSLPDAAGVLLAAHQQHRLSFCEDTSPFDVLDQLKSQPVKLSHEFSYMLFVAGKGLSMSDFHVLLMPKSERRVKSGVQLLLVVRKARNSTRRGEGLA